MNPLRETGAGGLGLYRPAQDIASLLLHGAAVAGRLLAQQALELIVEIADRQVGHEIPLGDCSACIVCVVTGRGKADRTTWGRTLAELDLDALGAGVSRVRRRGIGVGEPAPETCFETGDVVVLQGEPDALAAAEIRLLQGAR